MNPSDHHLISVYAVDAVTRGRAARLIAANARDAADLSLLLDATGLELADLTTPTEVTP